MSDTQEVLFKQPVLLLSAYDFDIEAKGNDRANSGVSCHFLPLGNPIETKEQKGTEPLKASIPDRSQWNVIKQYQLPCYVSFGMGMGVVKDSRGNKKQSLIPLTIDKYLGPAEIKAPSGDRYSAGVHNPSTVPPKVP